MADVNENAVHTKWEEVFQHPRFKQLVDARKQAEETASKLTAEVESLKKTFESQLQEARKEPQSELEKLQAHLKTLEEQYQTTAKSLQEAERSRMRLQVAQDLGIADWADELKGESLEELKAHGSKIVTRIHARLEKATPGIPPRGNGSPTAAPTTAQLQDPDWVRKNTKMILEAAQ